MNDSFMDEGFGDCEVGEDGALDELATEGVGE